MIADAEIDLGLGIEVSIWFVVLQTELKRQRKGKFEYENANEEGEVTRLRTVISDLEERREAPGKRSNPKQKTKIVIVMSQCLRERGAGNLENSLRRR